MCALPFFSVVVSSTIRVGTSAFTAAGWEGNFYPNDLPASDYLSFYAKHFDAVEVDSTFYRIPSRNTTQAWYTKTPGGFVFALKVPRTITHESVLQDCESELTKFLKAMEPLREKLGPLLFQFPYFNRKAFLSVEGFLGRLQPFLKNLPSGYQFAVEVRNKSWLGAKLAEALRERGVALALIDHPWMLRPLQLVKKIDPITADFTYVRWLGDRKGIEERTKTWNKVIVDREDDLREWVEILRGFNRRKVRIYAFANNHYAGHAPATVRLFRQMWDRA